MLCQDTHDFMRTLSEHFSKTITEKNGIFEIECEKLAKHSTSIKNLVLSKLLVNVKLKLEEQKVLSVYLSWIFNQFLCISVYNKSQP